MTEPFKGTMAMIAACTIWGLSPLYCKLVAHVPAPEVMAHRILWSLVFFGAVLAVQGRLRDLVRALAVPRDLRLIVLATMMISVNWFLFILSIQIGRTVEASLGYYIFPLLAVLLGRFVFAEALDRAQWLAVGCAALAVTVLTLGLGVAPWISLILATSFAFYGIIKKNLSLGPVLSVSCEIAVIAPFATGFLIWVGMSGQGALGQEPLSTAILVLSGPLTAIPLILFSYAARRITLGAVGVLQYVNPTLQFLLAVLIFAEPFGPWHAIAFALIWTAVALYSVSAIRRDQAARRARRAAAGVSATVR